MLKFFRTIRKKLIEQDNVRKYLLYAIGEILLVVIGILIALQVNNWNEQRKEREREQVYLNLLYQNLSRDLEFFSLNVEFYQEVLESGTRVLAYSNGEAMPNVSNWDLLVDIFHASQIWPLVIESSTYEELKSAGELSLIRNVMLRDRLGFYYGGGQFRYLNTIGINPPYRKMSRMLIPYDIQGYMWDECHETVGDTQILTDCESYISDAEAKKLLDEFSGNDELMGELSFFMSAIRAGWEPLREQKELCELLIRKIEESIDNSNR